MFTDLNYALYPGSSLLTRYTTVNNCADFVCLYTVSLFASAHQFRGLPFHCFLDDSANLFRGLPFVLYTCTSDVAPVFRVKIDVGIRVYVPVTYV